MKAFVINLDRRGDRRNKFESMCRRAGIEVERFRAIDGRRIKLPPTRRDGDRGIYASLLSHKAVIERGRELGESEVMVFEDDAMFPEWFAQEVEYFMSHVPSDWGMIYFGGHGWPRIWSHISGPVLRATRVQNLECYVVRNTAYDVVIRELERAAPTPSRWADQVLRDLQHQIPTYTMLNPIVRQAQDYSDNYNRKANDTRSRCDIPGWFNDAEGEEYQRQVRRFDKPNVIEIGTYKGRSASFVAELVTRRGGAMFCIDTWNCEPSVWGDFEWWMKVSGLRHCVNCVRMDAWEASTLFNDKRFDLVFIDADQTYEGTREQLSAWLPKLRDGGVIMGHDYTNTHATLPGVRQAIDEMFGKPAKVVESLWIYNV